MLDKLARNSVNSNACIALISVDYELIINERAGNAVGSKLSTRLILGKASVQSAWNDVIMGVEFGVFIVEDPCVFSLHRLDIRPRS